MTWIEFFASVLASSFIASALSVFVGWWRASHEETKRQKSEANYLAIQLVVILEEYTSNCVIRNWHNEFSLTQEPSGLGYKLPPIAPYPQDTSHWKSLHIHAPKLAERAMLFPNMIKFAEDRAEYEYRCEGNLAAIFDDVIKTGAEALQLAKDLRNEFRMKKSSVQHAEKIELKYREIQARNAE